MRRGPLYITISGLMFAIMLVLVKMTRARLDAFEILFWRGVTAAPLAYALARKAGLGLRRPGLFALRAISGAAAMGLLVFAAKGLFVADLELIHKLQPLVVALLAPWLLGQSERASPRVWALLCMGLCGCVLILAPDLAIGSVYGVAAVLSALCSAAAHLCVSALMRTDDSRVVVFHFQTSVMVMALVVIVVTTGSMPDLPPGDLWLPVLGVGLSATAGQIFMTQAYAEDRAPVIAAASYTSPIWAITADVVVFANWPGWNVIAGGALIVGAGMILLFVRVPAK